MAVIYEPRGRAREYSPLALNLYNGCDHGCLFCYCPAVCKKTRAEYAVVTPRPDIIRQVEREARKLRGTRQQVLLCFMGDPYCRANDTHRLTRMALEILRDNRIPVAILTKGGERCLQDRDIFAQFGRSIMVGATLTTLNGARAAAVEPGAAPPRERIDALQTLHEAGVQTWVSLEPVLDPEDTLEIIARTAGFVDRYKVGKVSAFPDHFGAVDWPRFYSRVVEALRATGKPFYVKADLRAVDRSIKLFIGEETADSHTSEPWGETVRPAVQPELVAV